VKYRGLAQRSVGIIDHVIVIVAAAMAHLLIAAVANARTDRLRRPKVEWRPLDTAQLTGRNQRRIHGRVAIGIQGQLVPHDVRAARLSREVEVAVIRDVDDRRLIGRCLVGDCQFVVVT